MASFGTSWCVCVRALKIRDPFFKTVKVIACVGVCLCVFDQATSWSLALVEQAVVLEVGLACRPRTAEPHWKIWQLVSGWVLGKQPLPVDSSSQKH